MGPGPLDGVRVLDLSWVLAGPLVGRLLADAGARVIKLEWSGRMDNTRLGRALPSDDESVPAHDRVPLFHALNAGKQSVGIDLQAPRAREIALALAATCDVVIENFAPGVLERLGLGYEVLSGAKADIILLSMSGTGRDGPLSDVPAYAPTVTSLAGLESIVGYPGEEPTGMIGANFADSVAGLFGVHAVLSALWARDATGAGQHIDYSEMEGVCSMLAEGLLDVEMNGRVMAATGNVHRSGAPYGVFATVGDDCWITLAVTTDDEWAAFCRATPDEPWSHDESLRTLSGRLAHKAELEQAIAGYLSARPRDILVGTLRAAGVAASPVYQVGEQSADEHFWERGLLQRLDGLPGGNDLVVYGSPWRLSGTPVSARGPAPRLGEHTRDVLRGDVGLAEAELDELVERGVLS